MPQSQHAPLWESGVGSSLILPHASRVHLTLCNGGSSDQQSIIFTLKPVQTYLQPVGYSYNAPTDFNAGLYVEGFDLKFNLYDFKTYSNGQYHALSHWTGTSSASVVAVEEDIYLVGFKVTETFFDIFLIVELKHE